MPPVFQHYKPLTQIVEEEQADETLRGTLAEQTSEDFPVRVSSLADQKAFIQFVKGFHSSSLNILHQFSFSRFFDLLTAPSPAEAGSY